MADWGRRLTWLLPLCFVGLVSLLALCQDRDFWRSSAALYQLAQEAATRGDHPRALELARKAWARNPGHSGYGDFLGWLYLEAGQPQAALEVCRQVLARDPQAAGALKFQALALDRLGERQQALSLLADHLKKKPQEAELLQAAAQIAARRAADHPLAVEYLKRLMQVRPEPQMRRQLVDLLISLDRYPEAITLQEEEVAEFPDHQEALHRLALIHYWHRDYQAATQVYTRLLERAASDAALRYEAARTAEAAHAVDVALAHYLWLYGRHRDNAEYAVALARLWSQKGRHAEAVGVLAPLMQEKADPELRRWYALELMLIRDFGKALKAYQVAWETGDTHIETIINLARLHGQRQHFHKAAAFWDEAVRRQLLNDNLRWEAALTYSYARRYQDAVEVLKPVDRQNPPHPRLLLFLGQLHFYQEHWGQAAHYFKAYLEKHPQDPEVHRQLAEALSFQTENQDAALEQYARALRLRDDIRLRLRRIHLLLKARRWDDAARELKECPPPGEPQLLREQARLYLWLGDLPEALRCYELYLRHQPQDRAGRLEKARVLSYLGRAPEALELLNRLRLDAPQDPAVRVAAIEAYLSGKDYPKALSLAQRELEPLPNLGLDERALMARCYAHSQDPKHLKRATELLLQNLRKKRHHHPSLLILTALLPRLPRYEDLNRVMAGLPGVRIGSPEHAAALAFFDGRLGRHGGKLDYILHTLQEYRRHNWPDNPGELLGLAWLAMELGERQTAAGYYKKALELRPNDRNIANNLVQCQLTQKDWGQALASLKQPGATSGTPLELARLYMLRGQFEGVKAAVAQIPEGHPDRAPGLLLLAQACRREGSYPEALKTLAQSEGKIPQGDWLMEKARTLEAMGDRGAAGVYEQVIRSQPDSQAARVARARQARSRGDWAAAHQAYALALKAAPQDIELLNELEFIRQQMRPQMASRGFPLSRGERRPEEAQRPWQFSRFDREPRGLGRSLGLTNYLPAFLWDVLPLVQPESLGFTDSNRLYGGIFRVSGGFWITKVLPVQVGVEYREYNQRTSRLRRGEVSLGAGPLSVGDRLQVSAELIGRRYWKRVDGSFITQEFFPFPIPHFLPVTHEFIAKESRNRLFGSLALNYRLGNRTDISLKYSRRDVFDQEAHLYPRLYQGVLNLEQVRLTSLHQGDLAFNHQFRPGLDWRGNVGGAFYSDNNRRFTLYQGLAWQPVREPRMQLEFTPHFYLAAYRYRREGYFSPPQYVAFGWGVDFHRQIFRLPTLILQGTVQGVTQHGDWGPALQGLAALEWEWMQNFYTDLHIFYFREWVDNFRLLTAGISFRWHF
jgi:tetratricopeptide (TPR) repeat protein